MSLSISSTINRKRAAFTIFEAVLTIMVVTAISAMTIIKFLYVIERARSVEAIRVLRDLKDYQVEHKINYGNYVGDGNILNFPKLAFNAEGLEYFNRIEVTTDPLNVGKIYRSNNSYHLNITDLGVVYCVVDEGPWRLCDRLGFKDVEFRKITEL